jgi:hypothetical protein
LFSISDEQMARTCLLSLVLLYQSQKGDKYSLVTLLTQKMLDLGAEISPLDWKTFSNWLIGFLRPQNLSLEFAKCPDLAEGSASLNNITIQRPKNATDQNQPPVATI